MSYEWEKLHVNQETSIGFDTQQPQPPCVSRAFNFIGKCSLNNVRLGKADTNGLFFMTLILLKKNVNRYFTGYSWVKLQVMFFQHIFLNSYSEWVSLFRQQIAMNNIIF